MSSGFTSSQQKQTQSTALPQAGQMENALYDQLMGMSNQQAGSLTEQNRLQRALLSPHETLQQLSQPFLTQPAYLALRKGRFAHDFREESQCRGKMHREYRRAHFGVRPGDCGID